MIEWRQGKGILKVKKDIEKIKKKKRRELKKVGSGSRMKSLKTKTEKE